MDKNRKAWQALAAGLVVSAGLLAGAPTVAGEVSGHFYDGDRRVPISVQADLVADFAKAPGGHAAALGAGATLVPGVGDSLVRIYRVSGITTRSTEAAAVPTIGAPVYRQGDSPAGRLMTLPGGVLVKFKPDWSRAQIDAFVAGYGVKVERKLAIDGNWFRIQTDAGAVSLQIANAMYESGQVLAASPNWWMETKTR